MESPHLAAQNLLTRNSLCTIIW